MINLIIELQNNLYIASRDIAGNSLFDVYVKASGLWGTEDSDFGFSKFAFQSSCYQADWNSDLGGDVVVFADGASAQAQTYTETNRLHAE